MASSYSYIFAAVLVLLAYRWLNQSSVKITENIDDKYDYIIVGSGTGGSILANRLSQNSEVKVLLIEAGEDDSKYKDEMAFPLYAISLQLNEELTSTDYAVPQKQACLAMNDQRCRLVHGRVLGGASSIDCMSYNEGSRYDYDAWAAMGCSGWSYDEIKKFFPDVNQPLAATFTSMINSSSDKLVVSDVRVTSLSEAFVIAGRELGYNSDTIDRAEHESVSYTRATVLRGVRVSSAVAYLSRASTRENLHVITNSVVLKVLIENKKAVGVEILRNGKVTKVKCTKEVIVTAGAIGSAQLLMLSGIGPKEHLESLNIPVVADLAVGSGLKDHVAIMATQFILREPIAITEHKSSSLWAHMDHFLFGTGFLSSTCYMEGSAYLKSFRGATPKHVGEAPDLRIQLINQVIGNGQMTLQKFGNFTNIKHEILDAIHGGVDKLDGISFMPVLIHPKSSGSVRLQSSDPKQRPVVDLNLLSNSQDVKVLVEGIKQSERFLETAMIKTLGPERRTGIHPSCKQLESGSDAYWECFIRHNAFPLSQASGTCRMGPKTDSNAVVDSQLKVYGVEGLRVADASVMPDIVSAYTKAAEIMIAEKAAAMIIDS